MTTATTLSIAHAARVAADFIDEGLVDGLPPNLSIQARLGYDSRYERHESVVVQFYGDDFSDVRAWAAWAGVEVEERTTGSHVFCDAFTETDGVAIRLTGNRAVPTEVQR